MGSPTRPLYDPGNDGTVERRSLRQAAHRGRLTLPASPAGNHERPRALTPPPGARSPLSELRVVSCRLQPGLDWRDICPRTPRTAVAKILAITGTTMGF